MDALRRLASERAELDNRIAEQVRQARAAGFSWAAIGAELGCTRQAAQQRYGQ